MSFKYLNRIIFSQDLAIKEVLKRFNETAIHTEHSGFGIIINGNNKCIGVVSEGDIRRKIIDDTSISKPIKVAMNKNFKFIVNGDSSHKILRQFDKKVNVLPVLDKDGSVVDLCKYSDFVVSARSNMKIIRAKVPVRVSFCGGGTDMSDYINDNSALILSSTINKYCTASILVREDNEIHIASKDLNLKYSAKNIDEIEFGDSLDLIKAAIKIMQPKFGFELETYAEFEPGTGLGGSSSLVVSVIGALNYFRNENQLDLYEIADIAYQVERIDMNFFGGWQDQYATTFGGFNMIEFRKNEVIVNPIELKRQTLLELEYNLMFFRIGGNRNSSDIQKSYMDDLPNKKKYFKKMTILTAQMKESLLKGEVKTFGDLLHQSWLMKKELNERGVTNTLINDCYKIAKDLGALGGKILGAGGSGYLLIYCSPLFQKKIIEKFNTLGVFQEPIKFCNNGLEVWSTKR